MTPFEEKLKAWEDRANLAWAFERTELSQRTANAKKLMDETGSKVVLELITHLRECLSVLEKKDEALETIIRYVEESSLTDQEYKKLVQIRDKALALQPSFLKEKSDG